MSGGKDKKKQKTTEQILFDLMVDIDKAVSVSPAETVKKLLILSTPRSGSSMFCEVLHSTGKIGECLEWLNPRYMQAYAQVKQLTQVNINEYLNYIVQRTIGNTGVFAVNVHIDQYLFLLKQSFDVMSLNFDAIFYLERKDKVAQAVSLAKASLSDQWSHDTKPRDNIVGPDEVDIAGSLHQILHWQKIYRTQLKSKVKDEFYYEEFSNLNDLSAFNGVLASLGVSADKSFVPATSLERQSGVDSVERCESFLKTIQGKRP